MKTFNISVGNYANRNALQADLKKLNVCFGHWAHEIFQEVELNLLDQILNLRALSVAELGFHEGACLQDIRGIIDSKKLVFCPAEVGPYLRLRYPDQPEGETLVIAMDPIRDSRNDPGLFCVRCSGDILWLGFRYGSPDYFWCADTQFVFMDFM